MSARNDPRLAAVGLDYVGLPVTIAFAETHADVLGFDNQGLPDVPRPKRSAMPEKRRQLSTSASI